MKALTALVTTAWDELNAELNGRPTPEQIQARALTLLTAADQAQINAAAMRAAFTNVSNGRRRAASLTTLCLPGFEDLLASHASFPNERGEWVQLRVAVYGDIQDREAIERKNVDEARARHDETVRYIVLLGPFYRTPQTTTEEAVRAYHRDRGEDVQPQAAD